MKTRDDIEVKSEPSVHHEPPKPSAQLEEQDVLEGEIIEWTTFEHDEFGKAPVAIIKGDFFKHRSNTDQEIDDEYMVIPDTYRLHILHKRLKQELKGRDIEIGETTNVEISVARHNDIQGGKGDFYHEYSVE